MLKMITPRAILTVEEKSLYSQCVVTVSSAVILITAYGWTDALAQGSPSRPKAGEVSPPAAAI
jgi:hypothetical protein